MLCQLHLNKAGGEKVPKRGFISIEEAELHFPVSIQATEVNKKLYDEVTG